LTGKFQGWHFATFFGSYTIPKIKDGFAKYIKMNTVVVSVEM
jgi:hypothetical protein